MVFQEHTYGVLIVSTSDKFIEATRALLPPTDYYPVETAHSAGEARRSLLEGAFDLVLIQTPLRYREQGKQTIYGPGSITAYLDFGVFGVILWHCMDGRTIATSDWIICGLVLLFIGVCCVLGPETIMKKRDNPYYFKTNGYYDRFLK